MSSLEIIEIRGDVMKCEHSNVFLTETDNEMEVLL